MLWAGAALLFVFFCDDRRERGGGVVDFFDAGDASEGSNRRSEENFGMRKAEVREGTETILHLSLRRWKVAARCKPGGVLNCAQMRTWLLEIRGERKNRGILFEFRPRGWVTTLAEMALIHCYECSKEISSLATACPACGAPPRLSTVPPPLPASSPRRWQTRCAGNPAFLVRGAPNWRGTAALDLGSDTPADGSFRSGVTNARASGISHAEFDSHRSSAARLRGDSRFEKIFSALAPKD